MYDHKFSRYCGEEDAESAVGKTAIDLNGKRWFCVGHNDLGVLYFAKSMKQKAKQYTNSYLAQQIIPSYGKRS